MKNYENKIDTIVDELCFINDKLHGEDRNIFAAYGARHDLIGDMWQLDYLAKEAGISQAVAAKDYCAATDLLIEIESCYEVSQHGYQLML